MSGPGERRRVVDLYSATPMAAARVAERLGYPTGVFRQVGVSCLVMYFFRV